MVASATCDLVPGWREYAALLRIQPLTVDTPQVKDLLGQLLKFQSTQRRYLPPSPQDPSDTLANTVLFDATIQIELDRLLFDGTIQIELDRLLLATRIGSLSLVGWRIFGSMIRSLLARTGDGEVRLRG